MREQTNREIAGLACDKLALSRPHHSYGKVGVVTHNILGPVAERHVEAQCRMAFA